MVVVGVGSELRGDDAAGIIVVRRLRKGLTSPNVLTIEGGVSPENFTSPIRRFNPSHVVLIDATDFGAAPGEIVFAEPEAIVGQSVSTHTIPLSIMASYLREQTGAKIALLGIQPKQVNIAKEMSDQVRAATGEVVEILSKKLKLL